VELCEWESVVGLVQDPVLRVLVFEFVDCGRPGQGLDVRGSCPPEVARVVPHAPGPVGNAAFVVVFPQCTPGRLVSCEGLSAFLVLLDHKVLHHLRPRPGWGVLSVSCTPCVDVQDVAGRQVRVVDPLLESHHAHALVSHRAVCQEFDAAHALKHVVVVEYGPDVHDEELLKLRRFQDAAGPERIKLPRQDFAHVEAGFGFREDVPQDIEFWRTRSCTS
jgi:hypothetical protein